VKGIDERMAATHTRDMNTTQTIARMNRTAAEAQLRETVAALPAAYLAMLGLTTQAAVDAYIAAEMEGAA